MKTAIQWIAGIVIILSMLVLASVALKKLKGKHLSYEIPVTKYSAIVRLHDADSGRFFCSAAIISRTQAVTAAHCVVSQFMGFAMPTQKKIEVRPANGKPTGIQVTHIVADARTDQALITGNFDDFEAMELETEPAEVINSFKTEELSACGFPYGGKLFCSKITHAEAKDFWFAADGNLYPGMSGGPVISQVTGKIIGINTAVDGSRCLLTPTVELLSNMEQREAPKSEPNK
jgi:V8-like Glu-specific endopeptidase